MNQENRKYIDIKELEKNVYKRIFEDGFWDIFIGMLILGIGFSWTRLFYEVFGEFGLLIFLLIWNIVSFFIFYLGKKYITTRRMGFVKFGTKRQTRQNKLKIFLAFNVIIGLIVFLLTITDLMTPIFTLGLITPLIIGILFFTVPLTIIAYFLEFSRLFLYSIIFGFTFFLSELLFPITGAPFDTVIAFVIPGFIVVLIGLIFLIKFIRKYPKPKSIEKF
jgi:hypothetical protein